MTVGVYSGLLVVAPPRSGKSLFAVSEIRRALKQGRMVATNLDIFTDKLMSPKNKGRVYRVPDWPTAADLQAMPLGNPKLFKDEAGQIQRMPGWREDQDGLLVLDELGTFLEARNWQEKGRDAVISWFLQAGKHGWKRIFIAQSVGLIDSQVRKACCEQTVVVARTDMIAVPFISPLVRAFGGSGVLPKRYVAASRRGLAENAPTVWKHFFGGEREMKGYNTLQTIGPEAGLPNGAGYWVLSAWEIVGRRMSFWKLNGFLIGSSLFVGALLGVGGDRAVQKLAPIARENAALASKKFSDDGVVGTFVSDGVAFFQLRSGKVLRVESVARVPGAVHYMSAGVWYK